MSTSILAVTAAMVKRKYPDTDETDANILLEAQGIEDDVLNRLSLSSAPADTKKLGALQLAVTLLTASELEGREPHSRADGSYREDKFSRVLWSQKAETIIRRFERVFERT